MININKLKYIIQTGNCPPLDDPRCTECFIFGPIPSGGICDHNSRREMALSLIEENYPEDYLEAALVLLEENTHNILRNNARRFTY
ncbi:MAG TPA: hypothetical protein P5136_00740 [Methanofastidiosum sp.]|nr:hypothetical protein [Methanofastidiosum sp.]